MLQCKKSVIGQDGSVRMTENGENAALVGRCMVLHSSKETKASGETSREHGSVKRSPDN